MNMIVLVVIRNSYIYLNIFCVHVDSIQVCKHEKELDHLAIFVSLTHGHGRI